MHVLLILPLLWQTSKANLVCDFTLTNTVVDRTTSYEVVQGRFYSMPGEVLLFEVSSPVNQLFWLRQDTTDIYYPDEKKLIRIITKDTLPHANPSPLMRLAGFSLEHELHRAGFVTLKAAYKGDTVFHYWNKKGFPEIVTGSIGDDLVLYRCHSRGWSLEFKVWDYREAGGKRFPLFLRSTVIERRKKTVQELRLSNLAPNQALPQYLSDFKIPPDATVKTVVW